MTPTRLLNDDGSASMATLLMLSHHAFRRDIARFAAALAPVDPSRITALSMEWEGYRGALHGHHHVEDENIFPSMRGEYPDLATAIDRLATDHQRIDPLLEQGDRAFARLPQSGEASFVVTELAALLDAHLDLEEATIIPQLRGAKEFPTPTNDAEAQLYAGGFAWSMQGIAPEVLAKVREMLPEALLAHLPAACTAFEERCLRVWGAITIGAATTSVPG